jgi:MFS family permease
MLVTTSSRCNSTFPTMIKYSHGLSKKLQSASQVQLAVYASITSFCLYSCIYTFRKTFAVATFEGLEYGGIDYKVWLVVFQVVGYASAKIIGIKVVSELKREDRARKILLMVSLSGLSWFFFGLVPAPWNLFFLFSNGLSLGMIWGAIFNYLEGRKSTEILGVGLSISFILASGMAKSIGGFLIMSGVSPFWMPFATVLLFIIPIVLFLNLLNHIPPPTKEDEALRAKRLPMDRGDRKRFFSTFWPGIILFVVSYILLTSFRDFRDNFASEIWTTLGYGEHPEIFTTAELPSVVIVLSLVVAMMFVRNNMNAFLLNHALIFFGFMTIGVACYLFQMKVISPLHMMMAIGTGLYMAYVPFNSIFFDRMLAAFQYSGTVGFIMYLSDSFGYLGSVATLLMKDFAGLHFEWLEFFLLGGYVLSLSGSVLILFSGIYFYQKYRRAEKEVAVQKIVVTMESVSMG